MKRCKSSYEYEYRTRTSASIATSTRTCSYSQKIRNGWKSTKEILSSSKDEYGKQSMILLVLYSYLYSYMHSETYALKSTVRALLVRVLVLTCWGRV